MISTKPSREGFDVILITGDAYVDHPAFGAGIIARVLENAGFSVGVISQPDWHGPEDFRRLGKPRLFFGITSGNMDSMVANYTPLKKPREFDAYTPGRVPGKRPDRAVVVYSHRAKEAFKDVPIVIGGIEASLRRLAHYDYWSNKVRRSILMDSKADVLVYGMGEGAVVKLARFYRKNGNELGAPTGLANTCIKTKDLPKGFFELPTFKEVSDSKEEFANAHIHAMQHRRLAQDHGGWFVVQERTRHLTTRELDEVYSLPYSRTHHYKDGVPALDTVRFSVTIHRGCFGGCSFCAIGQHQGKEIRSRSIGSILTEVRKLAGRKDFKGTIDDLGGTSANMYGMDCSTPCSNDCNECDKLDASHAPSIELLRAVKKLPGVRNLFVSSGIRHDLALCSPEYIKEIAQNHVPGRLKIAPEHVNPEVLRLMGKPVIERYLEFLALLEKAKPGVKVLPYFMAAHPGCAEAQMRELMDFAKAHGEYEQGQLFTPTPMTTSTCMYWTGMDPESLKPIYVPYTFNEKRQQKGMLLPNHRQYKLRQKHSRQELDPGC